METQNAEIISFLKSERIVSQGDHQSLARLLPHIARKTLEPGETLYRSGQDAEQLFFVLDGQIKIVSGDKGEVAEITAEYCGEESLLGSAHYMANAVAATAAKLLIFPRDAFQKFLASNPRLKTELFLSLMNRYSNEKMSAVTQVAKSREKESWLTPIGWLLTLILPVLVYIFSVSLGLEANQRLFLAIFSATLLMWVFRLTPDFVPGLFAVLTTAVFGLVPTTVILSGFSSDGFFMALSILGLSAVIVASGLSYRFLLWILKAVPQTRFWNNFSILLTGIMLSPVVPSINGRTALIAPLLIDMVEALNLKFRGREATRLATSAFIGVSLLSAVFLSSKSVNFVIFGLLPSQSHDQFQWMNWMIAASVCGAVMLFLYLVISPLFFRNNEVSRLSKEQVYAQLEILGPIKGREWASIFGVVVFGLGVVTSSIHRVDPPWIGLALLYTLLVFGHLRGNEFRDKIDWGFLMYLAGLVGMVSAMSYLGLNKWMAAHLVWMGRYMNESFPLFILVLTGFLFVLRLFAPINAAVAISAAVLMPLAEINGINPWVVGFIILTMGETWFMPYQCSYYVQFEEMTRKKRVYDELLFLKFNALSNLIKLAGIYASIPLWKSMGLL